MYGIRKAISGGAVVSVAVLGLLVVASAPAAAGPSSEARPFLTGALARGQPSASARSRAAALDSASARGSSKLDSTLAQVARRGRIAGFRLCNRLLQAVDCDPPGWTRDHRRREGARCHRSPRPRTRVGERRGAWRSGRAHVREPRAGRLAPSNLAALAKSSAVDLVRAPFTRVEHAVSGEEVAATLATAWHEKGFTGKGVKVAVIDGGFQGLAERQAEGELPANVVSQDFCGGHFATATDHGTAVAEIVHEMAPDAQLYLVCVDTEVDLAAAEAYAKSQGVHVINHSAGWQGPFRNDGSGPIGAIVADARANGILWVNSAGNEAQTHWSGTYSPAAASPCLEPERRPGQHVRLAERRGHLRVPEVGRVARGCIGLRSRALPLGGERASRELRGGADRE